MPLAWGSAGNGTPLPASFRFLDLFSGAGGLSTGLTATGLWTPVAGVECSAMAATSWATNHLDDPPVTDWETIDDHAARPVIDQLASGLVAGKVERLTDSPAALDWLRAANLDAIVGGPPCQGHSTNGQRRADDPRNDLIWTFLDVVEAVRPPIVVVENVVGMTHLKVGQDVSTFDAACAHLASLGYSVQPCRVNAAHYDTPQRRERVLIIGVQARRGAVAPLWASEDAADGRLAAFAPLPTSLSRALTVGEALADLDDDGYATPPSHRAYQSPAGLWRAARRAGAQQAVNHELPNHNAKTVERYRLYHAIAEAGLNTRLLPDATIAGDPDALLVLNDIPTSGVGRPGETVAEAAWRLRTRKRTQRVVVADQPAPTIGTLVEDWVHPLLPRTFTPREYARLQGFDDTFVFCGRNQTGGLRRRVDTPTYSQIGNAVPPLLGRAIGLMAADVLGPRRSARAAA